jgi:hypothetical protein
MVACQLGLASGAARCGRGRSRGRLAGGFLIAFGLAFVALDV